MYYQAFPDDNKTEIEVYFVHLLYSLFHSVASQHLNKDLKRVLMENFTKYKERHYNSVSEHCLKWLHCLFIEDFDDENYQAARLLKGVYFLLCSESQFKPFVLPTEEERLDMEYIFTHYLPVKEDIALCFPSGKYAQQQAPRRH